MTDLLKNFFQFFKECLYFLAVNVFVKKHIRFIKKNFSINGIIKRGYRITFYIPFIIIYFFSATFSFSQTDTELQKIIDQRTEPWGINVRSVEIRELYPKVPHYSVEQTSSSAIEILHCQYMVALSEKTQNGSGYCSHSGCER